MLTHFETSDFELFTFTSTNSTFSLLECLICLFIPSFCSSLYPLVLSVSPCFLISFTFFAIFIFLFFLILDRLFSFLFLFSSFHKDDFVCFPFLLDMFYIYFSCFVLCFCVLRNGFSFFVLTLLFCFLFLYS